MPPTPCPNASGVCATCDCEATTSLIWYGKRPDKYCQACYRVATKEKKKKRSRSLFEPVEEEDCSNPAGDDLVEIKKIYGCRCARRSRSHPPSLSIPPF